MAPARRMLRAVIGVYDSGFGGLTVLRALRARLPEHDFVYLGDSGRAPYGGRDADTILDFSEQCVERLFEEGCALVVVACHTVSCVALRHLQQRYVPSADSARRILGVTIPAAEEAVGASAGHIAVLGTARTIASRTFEAEIAKLGAHTVTARAAPLLAPIVEEGWQDTEIARLAIARYVAGLETADTLLLACTHYPLLERAFREVVPSHVRVLDPGPAVARALESWLARHPGFVTPGSGSIRALCTGEPETFKKHGERMLGAPLPTVQHVALIDGRLAHRDRVEIATGQVVRPSTPPSPT